MGYFLKNTSQGSRKLVWGMCHACFKSKLTKMSQGNPKYSEGRSKKDDKLRYGCKINVDGILTSVCLRAQWTSSEHNKYILLLI